MSDGKGGNYGVHGNLFSVTYAARWEAKSSTPTSATILIPEKQRIYGLIFSVCQKCAMDALQNRNRTGLRLDAPVLVVFAK